MNEQWAFTIIDLMVRHGVKYFCIAPGSRSTPLTLAVASHPMASRFIHFDERSLAFHALGHAKASLSPVAIIVTSGTAVGNLLPAVMEARASQIPLIVFTADRPPELRDCGANQTADQVKIFTSFVNWQVDLPCPDEKLSQQYLSSLISHACFSVHQPTPGPVHINCMFREPLCNPSCHQDYPEVSPPPIFTRPVLTLSDDDLDNLKKTIQNAKRGMILVGSLRSKKQAQMILAFAEKIRWPVICDIESFMRGMSSSKNIIKHFELLLRSDIKPNVDVLIHFGDRVVSKKIDSWISSHCKDHVHITEHFHRFDPSHNISSRYTCSTLWLCNKLLELSTSLPHQDHLEELVELCETISTALRASLSSYEMIHEPYIPYMLSCSNLSGYGVFFSNSMPIRDADNFFYPSAEEVEVFVTRGMSGIDGNISIVQGITSHLARPMIAVVGDLTFLHDIGSLEKLSHSLYPIIIFVINNGGGGIFSFLPIVKKEKEFEEFFATAHINRFEKVSEFAGVEFFCPRNTFELDELWNDLQDNPRTCVIEVLTNREQNVKIHEELFDRVKNQLCAQSIHAAL